MTVFDTFLTRFQLVFSIFISTNTLASVLKQFFINVSYYILVGSLILMALFLRYYILMGYQNRNFLLQNVSSIAIFLPLKIDIDAAK